MELDHIFRVHGSFSYRLLIHINVCYAAHSISRFRIRKPTFNRTPSSYPTLVELEAEGWAAVSIPTATGHPQVSTTHEEQVTVWATYLTNMSGM